MAPDLFLNLFVLQRARVEFPGNCFPHPLLQLCLLINPTVHVVIIRWNPADESATEQEETVQLLITTRDSRSAPPYDARYSIRRHDDRCADGCFIASSRLSYTFISSRTSL